MQLNTLKVNVEQGCKCIQGEYYDKDNSHA